MARIKKPVRILAIDPGLEEIGFVVFEERELVRYGVKRLRGSKLSHGLLQKGKHILRDLIEQASPHVLVLEKPSHKERKGNKNLRELIAHTKSLARIRGIKVYEYDPCVARERVFQEKKPTKKHVAELIASYYPELSAYVPVKRRILWGKKDFYWLNVFDAITLALHYLGTRK
ncbi:MAG: hypothetical protein WBD99_02635 [Thermodesulfobacteriota bacterium]